MLILDENKAIDFLRNELDQKSFALLGKYRDVLSEQLFNLISRNTINQIWQRHILDSYQLIHYLEKDHDIIDIGSGAGLPGIILVILGYKNLIMVDSSNKKVKFINETLKKLDLPDNLALHSRIENLKIETDIITARALKPIKEILEIIDSSLIVKEKLVLLKGAKTYEEIEDAKHSWQFEYKLHKSITSENSFIVEIFSGYRRKP